MAEDQPQRSRLERRRLELEEPASEEAFSSEESIAHEPLKGQQGTETYHRYVEEQRRDPKSTSRRSKNSVLKQVVEMIGSAGSRLFSNQERSRHSRKTGRSEQSVQKKPGVSSKEAYPKNIKKKRRFKRKLLGSFL
jgi:hypothetical protein